MHIRSSVKITFAHFAIRKVIQNQMSGFLRLRILKTGQMENIKKNSYLCFQVNKDTGE